MTTTKLNIGLAISRNYDKVSLEFLDEPISHETDEELKEGIQKRFSMLRAEITKEYGNIQKG